jgi:SnoaL-like polyketide cyclase
VQVAIEKTPRQYVDLSEDPRGYCPDHSTGVACSIGLGVRASSKGVGVDANKSPSDRMNASRPGTAITATAKGFYTAFPDMQVFMDDLVIEGDRIEYHWTFTGTNTIVFSRARICSSRATIRLRISMLPRSSSSFCFSPISASLAACSSVRRSD